MDDVETPDGGRNPAHRKVRSFRLGLIRATKTSTQFKPSASVGIAPDGGIFVTPFPRTGNWTYGVVRPSGPREGELVTTDLNVKLHYHRSGLVMPSLSGKDGSLDRRRLQLPAIGNTSAAQVLSIVTLRPWELPTQSEPPSRGTMMCRVSRWPDYVAWTISVVAADEPTQQQLLQPQLREQGLLALGTATHGIVSLSGHGHEAVVVVTTSLEHDTEDLPSTGGTTVGALKWDQSGTSSGDAFALWSSSLRNPLFRLLDKPITDLTPIEGTHVGRYVRTSAPNTG